MKVKQYWLMDMQFHLLVKLSESLGGRGSSETVGGTVSGGCGVAT